uniref:Endonuclease/exonuclease/phosphatase domain-containing protein n=1 Tax=Populus alba TaxID=43335 RepID=A0A4U5QRJ1_POPAL|nr:hypothetical protein D5086_0000053070 [Populus alba]
MIVHCWNVRRLNSPLKQHEVAGLMKSKKLDVCGLLETKLSLAKVACIHKLRLKTWQFVSNVEATAYARIVVFWNPETVKVEKLHFFAQGIHIMVTSLVHQFCFTTTFVYGFDTITARRALWEDFRRWGMKSPWLLLGDFNSILTQEEKHNGELVSTYEIADFRKCCSDLRIADLNLTGSHFIWTNVLRNHLSALVLGYLWVAHVYLYKKLKHLKGGLKTLTNLHFSHISERVARAGKELDDSQLLLQNDRDNDHLLALEKQQRLNLVNLKSAEKMFFGQTLKCTFFKDYDKGTRFINSLMSQ